MRIARTSIRAFASILLLTSSSRANEWDEAVSAVTRLSPSIFRELPAPIVVELIKQGCTVPQPTFFMKRKSNVISGSFARQGQKDYAILCSRDGVSHIQVIWGGTVRCPSELRSSNDLAYLQRVLPGRIGYSRAIATAPQRTIASYSAKHRGPRPPDGAHAGIEDIFIEKASAVLYCADGTWHELAGRG